MFQKIMKLIRKVLHLNDKNDNSKDAAKERLHLVLIQDRASVSADFLEVMKQEIIEVIKKYIEIDEKAIDVRLTNNANEDGTGSSPALYANFPITSVKNKVLNEKENYSSNNEKASIFSEDVNNKSNEKSNDNNENNDNNRNNNNNNNKDAISNVKENE